MAAGELKLSIRTYLLLLFHANPDMREARGFRAHFNDSLLSYTAAQITSLKGGSLGIGPSIQKFFCWDKRHHEDEHLMVKKVDDGSLDYSRLQKNLESLSKTFPPDAYRWFVRTLLSIVQQDSSIKEDWLSFVSPMIVEQYKKSSLNSLLDCFFHFLIIKILNIFYFLYIIFA